MSLLGALAFLATIDAQDFPTPAPVEKAAPTSTPDILLKYSEFLRGESKEHREFLESFYSRTAAGAGLLASGFVGLLAFLNWKSKKDIRDEVNRRFDAAVNEMIDARVRQIDRLIVENKRRFEADKEQINKILVELSSKTSSPPSTHPTPQKTKAHGAAKRILWVDDYPQNNDYPRQMFEQLGIRVELARSTEEAIQRLAHAAFDLIISDMGRGDDQKAGITLLQRLRAAGISTPVIIYTSETALREVAEEAIQLGAIRATSGVTELLSAVSSILLAT